MDEETEYLSISSAGIEEVEINMPERSPWNFFQQMVKERPELDERLVYFHWFVNKHRRDEGKVEKNIRDTVYDLLEHFLNEWVILDEENQSLESTPKSDENE